jgi:hypothetical protein
MQSGAFLTMVAQGGEVTDVVLDQVALADTSGAVYKVKNLSPSGYVNNVTILDGPHGNMGYGLIDPTSTPLRLALECRGYGCESVPQQAKGTLFSAFLSYPRTSNGSVGGATICQYGKCADVTHGLMQ